METNVLRYYLRGPSLMEPDSLSLEPHDLVLALQHTEIFWIQLFGKPNLEHKTNNKQQITI